MQAVENIPLNAERYLCACGKRYRSYAAVYTHIRNKHDSSKEVMRQIVRPQGQATVRGRPKGASRPINVEYRLYDISEQGLLKFFEMVGEDKESIL